ncbi:acetoacetate--CoA ligase [Nitrococcus mobilis]|uniref:Acetoacetyl-CoA synthase n=1 Tax=Nitrococcus mobilis Nb-231 TaxID=314278 RepID=A4BUN8_9GAMM|nr:acetoacetate--CoA ligase [Nitrococcus mobilis]EAR20604.1 Acetoacetyl-CoA synthase [Nitrococcus mobilis Nb-231]
MSADAPILRQSTARDLQHSNMAHYQHWLEARGHGPFQDYQALHQWSVRHLETFWESIWEHTGVIASQRHSQVLGKRGMPGAEWFPGAQLNFAENLLREALHGDPDKPAITAVSESRPRRQLNYGELYDAVGAWQGFLLQQGVRPGDRVAGIVANTPEALIAMLATTSIGAVWSSVSPEFGVNGILDRFGQIEPKLLVADNGYRYAGKSFTRVDQVRTLQRRMASVETVVLIDNLPDAPCPKESKHVRWENALAAGRGHRLTFAQLPFDHPLYILYSSGTTGVPKCLVHGAGGILLQHSKELLLQGDIGPRDRFFYYTTTGWMMWNWLVSGLLTGAELLLFDGSPSDPSLDVLWTLAERERITHFGTSAKFLGSCRNAELRPGQTHDLERLRVIFSTGSPLLPEDFDYVYQAIKADVLLGSISGGTDIVSCFVGVSPTLPVRRGEIQCKMLGMDVKAFDPAGHEIVGEPGELVCTQPAPSMPVKFWNDPSMVRYRSAYFAIYPGVWAQGDYITFYPHGGSTIHGRCDATLNPGGVRIGTAEIYRPVETISEIADSLAVGQPWQGDVRVVLMVVLNEGHALSDELRHRIRQRIREQASPRHVPAKIIQLDEIPYTRSGKKVELAVAKLLRGETIANRAALANPDSLDKIAAREELFK